MGHRSTLFLAAGAAAGIAAAAAGLVWPANGPAGGVPEEAAAVVNGEIIRMEDYQRILDALARDKRQTLEEKDRKMALDRLIEEELLVQRAIALGMPRLDRKIRGDLTNAVIASVVTEFDDVQPTDAELEAFYREQREFFVRPGAIRVRQVQCRAASSADDARALECATEAARRLRTGEEIERVRADLGTNEALPLPDRALPPAKLREYVGPTALSTILGLAPGAVSEPVRGVGGYSVFQVIERQPDYVPELSEIRAQVVAEFRRRRSEAALRKYLDDLRRDADVRTRPGLG